MGIILVARKQLCKDRNCQQCMMASRPLVKPASVNVLIFLPLDRGLRASRWTTWGGVGMGQHRNGDLTRSVNRTPVWGCGNFSWGRIQSPLEGGCRLARYNLIRLLVKFFCYRNDTHLEETYGRAALLVSDYTECGCTLRCEVCNHSVWSETTLL